MPWTYEIWLKELQRAAVEDFFFSPEVAEQLTPERRLSWEKYYEEGFGPEAALEEDLNSEVRS